VGAPAEPVAGPDHRESLFALQITSTDGVRYVNLDAALIGAIRVPILNDPRYSAILVSLKLDGDTLHVTLAGEKGELDTVQIGRYELTVPQGVPGSPGTPGPDAAAVRVPELASLREGAWELRLVSAIESTIAGCCSCSVSTLHGRLHEHPSLNCCPSAGRCLGCGGCGVCCG
jgi:hypothetical protein